MNSAEKTEKTRKIPEAVLQDMLLPEWGNIRIGDVFFMEGGISIGHRHFYTRSEWKIADVFVELAIVSGKKTVVSMSHDLEKSRAPDKRAGDFIGSLIVASKGELSGYCKKYYVVIKRKSGMSEVGPKMLLTALSFMRMTKNMADGPDYMWRWWTGRKYDDRPTFISEEYIRRSLESPERVAKRAEELLASKEAYLTALSVPQSAHRQIFL